MSSYTFRAILAGQTYELPDYQSVNAGFDGSDVSGLTLVYPKDGVNSDVLVEDAVVVAYLDGVEVNNGRWLILARRGKHVDDNATTITRIGKSLGIVLDKAILLPASAGQTERAFTAQTPGLFWRTLIQAAQTRGALTGITLGFTDANDSSGQPWPANIAPTYKVGQKYLSLMRDQVKNGTVEWRFNGNSLEIFAGGRKGVDRTVAVTGAFTAYQFGDDTGSRFEFGPAWTRGTNASASGGNFSFNTDGAAAGSVSYIEYRFKGNQVEFGYLGNINGGIWAVILDGVQVATLDTYRAALTFNQTWNSGLLANTDHTVRIVPVGKNPTSQGHYLIADYMLSIDGGRDPVVLEAGRDYAETPWQSSTEDRASFVLVQGNEGTQVQYTNPEAQPGPFGREEISISQGGTKNTDLLLQAGQVELQGRAAKREQFTRKVDVGNSPFEPLRDYEADDFIYERVDGQVKKYRVAALVLSVNQGGERDASITLNDYFDDRDVKAQRALDAAIGGVPVTGAGGAPTPVPAPSTPGAADTVKPNPVTSILFTANTSYLDTEGAARSTLTITWQPPANNTDGTPFNDLREYRVRWIITNPSGETTYETVDTATATLTDVPPGSNVQAGVRAVDTSGNMSDFAYASATAAPDTTPPATPSTPTAEVDLGQVIVRFDGLNSVGGGFAADVVLLELHRSTVSNFTPAAGTLVDRVSYARGKQVFRDLGTDLAYGTPYFYRLIAVDRGGLKSAASAQVSATVTRLTGLDLEALTIATSNLADNAITGVKIIDGAVANAKIADLAINSAKLAELAVAEGKIASGAVTATKIADLAVGTAKIDGAAITTAKIANLAVTNALIANLAVDNAKIANLAVDNAKIANLAVDTAKIADAAIATAKIGDAAITTAKIGDLQVVNAKIANLAVDNAKIANLAVGKLTTGALIADVTLSARIATAMTGARAEMNSTGFLAYNGTDASPTFQVMGSNGTVTIMGVYRTAFAGQRIEMGTDSDKSSFIMYSGVTGETSPARMVEAASSIGRGITMRGPVITGTNTGAGTSHIGSYWLQDTSPVRATGEVASVFTMQPGAVQTNTGKPASAAGSWQLTVPTATSGVSAMMEITSAGTSSTTKQIIIRVDGGSSGFALRGSNDNTLNGAEVMNRAATAYARIVASAFAVGSDVTSKESIAPVDLGGIAALRTLQPKGWTRRVTGDKECGFIAQDLPEVLQRATADGIGYSVTEMLALTVQALKDVDTRLQKAESRLLTIRL